MKDIMFPSPFGVMSFLMDTIQFDIETLESYEFPSPFGVISFLI